MRVSDDTVYVIDTTTSLTERQRELVQVMFADKEPGEKPRILVIPLYLTYTDEKKNVASIMETHIEEVAGSIEEFLADSMKKPIGTSQPGPLDFAKTFERADELGYRHAICLFLPYQLSRTCELAQSAASKFNGDNLEEIYVPLSNFGSGEVTLTLDQLLKSGADRFEILKKQADWLTNNARLWIVPEGLERLRDAGRISNLKYMFGSAMNVHPILSVGKTGENRGRFIDVGKIRGNDPEKIGARMVELATEYLNGGGKSVACVINKNMDENAKVLAGLASDALGYTVPVIDETSSIIYKVVGPAVGLAVLPLDYRG